MIEDPNYFSIYRTAVIPKDATPWNEILSDRLKQDLNVDADTARKMVYPAEQARLTVIGGKELSLFYAKTGLEPGEKQTNALKLLLGKVLQYDPALSPYTYADLAPVTIKKIEVENRPFNAFLWAYGSGRAATERKIAVNAIQRFYGVRTTPRSIFGTAENTRHVSLAHIRDKEKLPAAQYIAHLLETEKKLLPKKVRFSPIKMDVE